MMPRSTQIKKKSSMHKRHTRSVMSGTNVTVSDSGSSHSITRETPDVSVQELVAKAYTSLEEFIVEFNSYCDVQILRSKQAYETSCEEVMRIFCSILLRLPDAIKFANINGTLDMGNMEEKNNQDHNSTVDSSICKLPSSIATVELKQSKTPRKVNFQTFNHKTSSSAAQDSTTKIETFKTPFMSARRFQPGTTITPKIYNETPITVMRRPQHGEMAISLSGSPLMVGATSSEDIPTVNVPMQDGRIFSIIPEVGAPPFDLPCFDETTRKYLKTLRHHLQILAPNTP